VAPLWPLNRPFFSLTKVRLAHGFRSGLRFLSLMMLAIGLTVAILLAKAGKDLRAPTGSGYS
jgi:hypothetical protein